MMKRTINKITSLIISGIIMVLVISCNVSGKYEKEERAQIASFLSNSPNLNFELKPSGLYYYEVTTGNGDLAKTHDTAYIKYTLKFLSGDTLFTNFGTTDTLIVQGVNEGGYVAGFDEGVTYMREGGNSMFLVPSVLAYGTVGVYDYMTGYVLIPGYTPLLFDVELVKLVPGP